MTRVMCLLLLVSICLATSLASAARPHIVFIMADDMGYGDVQALNSDSKIPTPNLNRLAEEGMTFTDAHSPSAVCTPTRYGVVTGRYCWRSKLKRGVLNGYGEPLIEKERPTVASFLKSHGYHTGVVGKWHLGLGFAKEGQQFDFSKPLDHTPVDLGFEESYVIPASLDFPPYVFIKDRKITQFPSIAEQPNKFPAFWRKGERAPNFVMEDVLDHLTEKATDFITEHAAHDDPFFLYFPLTAPHKPVLPHPRFRGKTELGPYGDFVVQVDDTVGRVLKAIDDAGITENTLVFYTSDNGSFMYRYEGERDDHVSDETIQGYTAAHHTANHIYRGTKADVWEAGHRVPFFARWPEKIKAGTTYDNAICHVDLFATCAEIIGKELPEEAAPDSFSLLAAMQGQVRDRAPVINHSASGMFAIRSGNWKLVLGNGSGGRQAPKGKPFEKPYFLFDLASDPGETTNVIDDHPEIALRLEKVCLRIRESGRSH